MSGKDGGNHERRRWLVLAALFAARTTFGFQYQALAVTAPFLPASRALDYATLGLLMGLYMLPGAVVAVPGGVLGQRFGEKRIALCGLGLMAAGGVVVAMAADPGWMAAGRLASGAGAVLINVSLAKMLADWFAGREIVLAMGVLASSWSMGIGFSFLALPAIVAATSADFAMMLPALLAAAAFLLVALAYAPPPGLAPAPATLRLDLSGGEWAGVLLAGAVWGTFNSGFAITLVFAPGLLAAAGLSAGAAAGTVSLINWAIIVSLPFGGHIARWAGSPTLVMHVSFAALAAIPVALAFGAPAALTCIVYGLASGPVAGLIMALPAMAVAPRNRAAGMGIFFGVYYAAMAALVPLAGWLRDRTGDPAAPLLLAGACMVAAAALLGAFAVARRRLPAWADQS